MRNKGFATISLHNRGFAHILILIIVVFGIGALGYYSWQKGYVHFDFPSSGSSISQGSTPTPTSDPTSNWKTYTNNTLGISFKYPSAWTYIEEADHKHVQLSTDIPQIVGGGGPQTYIIIVSIRDVNPIPQLLKINDQVKPLGNETINGLTFEKYSILDMYVHLDYLYSKSDGKIVYISVSPYNNQADYNQKVRPVFDQILSTFKFIEKSDETLIQDAIKATAFAGLIEEWRTPETKVTVNIFKIEGGFAKGGVLTCLGDTGDCASYVWIAAKHDGTWTQVWGGQEVPRCSDIADVYPVPEEFSNCQNI